MSTSTPETNEFAIWPIPEDKVEYGLPLMHCQQDGCTSDMMQFADLGKLENDIYDLVCRCPDCQKLTSWAVDADVVLTFLMHQKIAKDSLEEDLIDYQLKSIEAEADLLADIVDIELLREEQLIFPEDVIHWREDPYLKG